MSLDQNENQQFRPQDPGLLQLMMDREGFHTLFSTKKISASHPGEQYLPAPLHPPPQLVLL